MANKLRSSVEEGCLDAIKTLEGWVVNWSVKPDFEYTVNPVSDLEVAAMITVADFEVAPGFSRWEAIDKGTDPVTIDQKAKGRKWKMKFPFTHPYPAKSIAADGSGGGPGRVGPQMATWKIVNRSIKPRGWTNKIKERYPYIKMAMKRGFENG